MEKKNSTTLTQIPVNCSRTNTHTHFDEGEQINVFYYTATYFFIFFVVFFSKKFPQRTLQCFSYFVCLHSCVF